jgi:hypothetical protein
MERRSFPRLLASLAVTVSMTACTADQMSQLNGMASQALAQADVFFSAILSNGQTASLKPQDLADIQVNGKTIDANTVQLGTNGQMRIQGLTKGENLIKIRKKGGTGYVSVPVIVNEDGSLTIVSAQVLFDDSGNPTEASGGQADASGNLDENGFGFKQTGNDLFFRDPQAGNVQQFDLSQGQFKRGQGQQFADVGQDMFRAGVPKVKLQTDRTFTGQLLRLKIGNNFPPPFAAVLQEGQPLVDLPAFGPQNNAPGQQGKPGQMGPGQQGQVGPAPTPKLTMFGLLQASPALPAGPAPTAMAAGNRPQVVFWYRTSEGAFKRVTLELDGDVQGPWQNRQGGQGGMMPPPGGMQGGGMQPPPGGAPAAMFGFDIKQMPPNQQPPSGGMKPPPGGMQPPPGGQPGGMQPGGMPGGQAGGMQPPRDPFQGFPKLQTISAKVVSEEAATEAEIKAPPQGGMPPGGGQPPPPSAPKQ